VDKFAHHGHLHPVDLTGTALSDGQSRSPRAVASTLSPGHAAMMAGSIFLTAAARCFSSLKAAPI